MTTTPVRYESDDQEAPATSEHVRCVRELGSGQRCSNNAMYGETLCEVHAPAKVRASSRQKRELKRVEKVARKLGGAPRLAENTRLRLLLAEPDAIDTLIEIHSDPSVSKRDRTQAATALVRAAERVREGGDGITINNTTVVAVDANAELKRRLDNYRDALLSPREPLVLAAEPTTEQTEDAG